MGLRVQALEPDCLSLISGCISYQLYKLEQTRPRHACMPSCVSRVRLLAILWTVAHQAPLSMGFSRQEFWGGFPCPAPGDLLTHGFNSNLLHLLHWQVGSLSLCRLGSALTNIHSHFLFCFSSVQFSHSVVSSSLRPHELQHTRPPCPSPTPGVHSDLRPSIESVMPSSHLILCHPLFLLPPIPPSIRVFPNESNLCMRWPKYWSFSFSIIPSKEHPGLISFRMD